VKGGGHVTSAAILDFRIFPEKSEEKKDIKNVCVKIIFSNYFSTEIHGQTSDKKQLLFDLYRHFLLKKM
jgi:hypothetical protein